MPDNRVRIMLVDDFKPWREAVRLMLQDHPEVEVVAEVADGEEAVKTALQLRPDLLLLDIAIPGLNGIEASKRVHGTVPKLAVIYLTMSNHPGVVQQAFSNGAKGYVLKADAGKELWPAIEAVLEGRRYVSSGLNLSEPV